MKKPEIENLALKLADELNSIMDTIPGVLNLSVYSLRTIEEKIKIQLKSQMFLDMFQVVDDISQLDSGDYQAKVKIGDLVFIGVLNENQIQKYSADTSASNQPGPV